MNNSGVIYLDVLFATEVLMNSLVLILYEKISRKKYKKSISLLAVLVASVLGAGGIVAACSADWWNSWCSLFFSCTVAFLELAVLQLAGEKQKKIKKYAVRKLILEMPALFAGAFFLAGILLIIKSPQNPWSMGTLTGTALLGTGVMIISITILRIQNDSPTRQNQKTVRITLGEETYIVTAITDTGNNLYDKSDGMPIHIVEEGSILKEEQKERLLKEEPERFTFVPYSSLGNSHGLLTVLQVERILILDHGKSIALENQKLGLTNQKLSGNDLFQMLLHPDLEACGHGKGGCI